MENAVTVRVYEAANPKDAEELTNERDALWAFRALRGDWGKYTLSGPYDENGKEPFVVLTRQEK
jgi:hypothetical protein